MPKVKTPNPVKVEVITEPFDIDVSQQIVTTDQLRDILYQRRGSCFINFRAEYDMTAKGKMLKKHRITKEPNPYFEDGLIKTSNTFGGVTFDYKAGVERRLDKEGKDTDDWQQGTSWSQAVVREDNSLTPLSIHKADINDDGSFKPNARVYLRFRFDSSYSKYFSPKFGEIPVDELRDYLPAPSEYSNQNLDEPLKFITVCLNNLVSLKMDNIVYKLEHHIPPVPVPV